MKFGKILLSILIGGGKFLAFCANPNFQKMGDAFINLIGAICDGCNKIKSRFKS